MYKSLKFPTYKTRLKDGPAVEFDNGYKEWWLNDKPYTEEQFHQEIIKLKLERLKNL